SGSAWPSLRSSTRCSHNSVTNLPMIETPSICIFCEPYPGDAVTGEVQKQTRIDCRKRFAAATRQMLGSPRIQPDESMAPTVAYGERRGRSGPSRSADQGNNADQGSPWS